MRSVLPDCCDLVEELRLFLFHIEGEFIVEDDDAVAGVAVFDCKETGDFLGVAGTSLVC